MTTGKNTLAAIVMIFENSPIPNKINMIGNIASVGIGISAIINGEKKWRIVEYIPINSPNIIAGVTPTKNPKKIRNKLIFICSINSPEDHMEINVSIITVGGGKNLESIKSVRDKNSHKLNINNGDKMVINCLIRLFLCFFIKS